MYEFAHTKQQYRVVKTAVIDSQARFPCQSEQLSEPTTDTGISSNI